MNKSQRKTANSIFSKIVVIIIIFLNAWFAKNVFSLYNRELSVPSYFIYCWFAFTTGELAMTFGVKKEKLKNLLPRENFELLSEKSYAKSK